MWDTLLDIGKGILGTAVGNIPIIGGIAKSVLGLDPKSPTFEQDANAMFEKNPEKMIEFKKALFSHQEEMAKIDIASRKLQTDINLVDAQSKNKFQTNWRPFIGWTGGFGFAYTVLIQPLGTWASGVLSLSASPPLIESTLLLTVLGGILGIGGMRSYDKSKGIDTK